MTLIAGIVCDDGVILAADSASTDLEAGTKQPFNKIKRVGNHKILYGGSGDVGLLQKIGEALQGMPSKDTIKRIRQELRVRVIPELQEANRLFAHYPAPGFDRPPPAVLLFAGILNGRPWLLEIERNGTDTLYDKEMGNFAAIGSGKPWAQAIFRPYLYTPRNLELGKLLAYRVMDDAIALASGFIAGPIHVYLVPVTGEITMLSTAEMKRLGDLRELWRSMEEEAVGKLLAPRPEPAAPEPGIPTPHEAPPGTGPDPQRA